jgi:hypothetical protein
MRRRWCSNAALTLVFFLGSTGCETDCAGDCPKVGEAATGDDVRLVVTERSFGFVEMDGYEFELDLQGELVLRPKEPGCVASLEQPCRVDIRRLEIRPKNFTTAGYTSADQSKLTDMRLALDAPLTVVNDGLQVVVDEGRTVHSCLAVDDTKQHATGSSESPTLLHLDDRGLGIQAASIQGVWPLVFFDVSDECRVRVARMTIEAEAFLP